MRSLGLMLLVVLVPVMVACSSSGESADAAADGATADSAAADSAVIDSGADASDSGAGSDSGRDSGAPDSGTIDSAAADSGAVDSAAADSAASDSGNADSGSVDSSAGDAGTGPTNCDRSTVSCRRVEPACPDGKVAEIEGSCFTGRCVSIDQCVCTSARQCPMSDRYTCHMTTGRCGPYL